MADDDVEGVLTDRQAVIPRRALGHLVEAIAALGHAGHLQVHDAGAAVLGGRRGRGGAA